MAQAIRLLKDSVAILNGKALANVLKDVAKYPLYKLRKEIVDEYHVTIIATILRALAKNDCDTVLKALFVDRLRIYTKSQIKIYLIPPTSYRYINVKRGKITVAIEENRDKHIKKAILESGIEGDCVLPTYIYQNYLLNPYKRILRFLAEIRKRFKWDFLIKHKGISIENGKFETSLIYFGTNKHLTVGLRKDEIVINQRRISYKDIKEIEEKLDKKEIYAKIFESVF